MSNAPHQPSTKIASLASCLPLDQLQILALTYEALHHLTYLIDIPIDIPIETILVVPICHLPKETAPSLRTQRLENLSGGSKCEERLY